MWYTVNNIDEIDSPALVIYPERVRQNIRFAIDMVGDVKRLRPHMKTNKCAQVACLMQEAGITKFKCATIAEAEMLGMTGAADVLLAYQPGGPKLARFICLLQRYPGTKWSCIVDNIGSAREMNDAFAKQRILVPVYLDINTGMNRTGIGVEHALELFEEMKPLTSLYVAGIHAYDGHITDPDMATRTGKCNTAFEKVDALRSKLGQAGLQAPVVIAGGSPTFPIHAKRMDTECSPGTFVYWDQSYRTNCAEQPFLPAAVLVTRVVSNPAAGIVCTDLGHKSVASENPIGNRVHFLHDNDLQFAGHSEEHLVMHTGEQERYPAGKVLYGLPFHICPTVALYEQVHIAENGIVTQRWKNTARDRQINC